VNSVELGNKLAKRGYLLSCNSEYLAERNWIQICLMGDSIDSDAENLIPLIANPDRIDE
jgi:predicted DNA-binding protein (MmcQ/YjbR family)